MLKELTYPNLTFKQKYMINEKGEIFSPYRGFHKLKNCIGNCGYYRAHLSTTDGFKFIMVHRLVMETFSPNPNSRNLQVNHIDGNKTNNNLENLEWCTGLENMRRAKRIGLRDNLAKGEQIGGNVLTEKQVLEICEELKNPNRQSYAKIGAKYGVSKYAIHDIKRKRSWSWLTTDYCFE